MLRQEIEDLIKDLENSKNNVWLPEYHPILNHVINQLNSILTKDKEENGKPAERN